MTNVQIERLLSLLEKIADGLRKKDSFTIRLEFTSTLYNEGDHKCTMSRTYAKTMTLPYKLSLSVSESYTICIDSICYNGPEFDSANLSLPVFTAISYIGYIDSHNKHSAMGEFKEKEESLFANGWQLVREKRND